MRLSPHRFSTLFPYTTLFRSYGPVWYEAPKPEHPEWFKRAAKQYFSSKDQLLTLAWAGFGPELDRKSTRLNSSHLVISYAVFCLKKKRYMQINKWISNCS